MKKKSLGRASARLIKSVRSSSAPFFLAIFILLLVVQINHVGVMGFFHDDKGMGSKMVPCGEAQKTGATERCVCCVIEQADKHQKISLPQGSSAIALPTRISNAFGWQNGAHVRLPAYSRSPVVRDRLSGVVQRK